jgi:hypothetical protein
LHYLRGPLDRGAHEMAREANVPEISSPQPEISLDAIIERLERIHLQLHLEAGLLNPASEMARRLLDLTEETEAVLQRVRSFGGGHSANPNRS